MLKVGITGGMGSGKSTVCNILKNLKTLKRKEFLPYISLATFIGTLTHFFSI